MQLDWRTPKAEGHDGIGELLNLVHTGYLSTLLFKHSHFFSHWISLQDSCTLNVIQSKQSHVAKNAQPKQQWDPHLASHFFIPTRAHLLQFEKQ